jgi:hypothetical protein
MGDLDRQASTNLGIAMMIIPAQNACNAADHRQIMNPIGQIQQNCW